MQFEELRAKVKKIGFEAVRFDKEEFFEGFITIDKLPNLVSVLEAFLGPPAISSSQEVSAEAQKVANEFGGVWKGQTFYFQRKETRAMFAMLWPWADKAHVTLKLGQK